MSKVGNSIRYIFFILLTFELLIVFDDFSKFSSQLNLRLTLNLKFGCMGLNQSPIESLTQYSDGISGQKLLFGYLV